MNEGYWDYLDRLVRESRLVIDRPKNSHHPRYAEMVYPLDYGFLEGTRSGNAGGIDVWVGTSSTRSLSGIILTIDLKKRDSEIKILLGCLEEEIQTILAFHNENSMRALLMRR